MISNYSCFRRLDQPCSFGVKVYKEVDRDVVILDVEHNALHLASSEGCLDLVRYLVKEQGFDANKLSSEGDSPLHLAAPHGHLDIIKYFVEEYCAADSQARFNMLFATDENSQTAYAIALYRVDREDEYANEELVKYVQSYVTPLAVPAYCHDDEPCVKLNPDLTEDQREVAQQTYNLIDSTEAHAVVHHIMGYLCLSDVK
mmetsp:Transcript_25685/g.42747  ORF Transcript_25685/g.42747 Transcript_25685/m.42747 type:complete len:201 (+) Transcript_25685:1618-2220(+)